MRQSSYRVQREFEQSLQRSLIRRAQDQKHLIPRDLSAFEVFGILAVCIFVMAFLIALRIILG